MRVSYIVLLSDYNNGWRLNQYKRIGIYHYERSTVQKKLTTILLHVEGLLHGFDSDFGCKKKKNDVERTIS